jgi:hypothetical protein
MQSFGVDIAGRLLMGCLMFALGAAAQEATPIGKLTSKERLQIEAGMRRLRFQVSPSEFTSRLEFLRPYRLNPVIPEVWVCSSGSGRLDIALRGGYEMRLYLNENPYDFKSDAERQLAGLVYGADLRRRDDSLVFRVRSRASDLAATLSAGRRLQEAEDKPEIVLQTYLESPPNDTSVFAEASKAGVDYRTLLRGAMRKDAASLSAIFQYTHLATGDRTHLFEPLGVLVRGAVWLV